MQTIFATIFLVLLSLSVSAQNTSPVLESDPQKRAEAHRQVAKDKKVLEAKLRQGQAPEDISQAKTKLQTDRVEKNRQDFKHHSEKNKLKDDSPQAQEAR